MSDTPWTKGPWELGEFDEYLGYDAMTGGIRVGPVTLDAADYGQTRVNGITPEIIGRITADARLISAAPDMAEALAALLNGAARLDDNPDSLVAWAKYNEGLDLARAALAKARGGT